MREDKGIIDPPQVATVLSSRRAVPRLFYPPYRGSKHRVEAQAKSLSPGNVNGWGLVDVGVTLAASGCPTDALLRIADAAVSSVE